MGATLVNETGYQPGVEADESGINVENFDVEYKPESKEFLKNRVGSKIGFSVLDVEADITVDGEVNAATGLMSASFSAAVVLANDTDQFGLTSGGIYLDSVNIKQNRENAKLRSASFKLSKNKNIP